MSDCSSNSNKRSVGDGEGDDDEGVAKKEKKLTVAQQAKADRLAREEKEQDESFKRREQARDVAKKLVFEINEPGDYAPVPIVAAIKEIPELSRLYVKYKRLSTGYKKERVSAEWDWETDSWKTVLLVGFPDEVQAKTAVEAFVSDAPGVRAGVTKLRELMDAAVHHIECVIPADLFGVNRWEKCPWFNCYDLFDFVGEKHPEVRGTRDEPLGAEDYHLCDLVSMAKRILVDAHKHHVLTEPVPLLPIFQETLERKDKKGKGKDRK